MTKMLRQKYRSNFLPRRPLPIPRLSPTTRLVDPVAFFTALIGGPVLFTLATFWAIIPVFALAFGGLPYLLFGTPILLIYLARKKASPGAIAGLAFLTVATGIALLWALAPLAADPEGLRAMAGMGLFGLAFGPIWGLCFAGLYSLLERKFYRTAAPNLLI